MGIKKILYKVGDKAANRVASLSALSSDQIEQINNNREDYLSRVPDPNDTNAVELSNRLLAASSVEIFDLYLSQIKELYRPIDNTSELGEEFDSAHNIRYLKIGKWVTDKNENSLEKLVNVYDVLSKESCNIALVFNRKVERTDVFLATVNTLNSHDNTNSDIFRMRIEEAIRGNFPGSEWDKEIGKGRIPCLDNDKNYSVATATNIPTEKSDKFISQTIEKLLDGIVPDCENKEYTLILLATPIGDVQERKMRLSEFYSGLSPYSSWQTNYTFTEAKSNTAMASFGVNIGSSAGSQRATSIADTKSTAETISEARAVSNSVGTNIGGVEVNYGVTNTLGRALSTVLATTEAIANGTNNALNLGANFSRASNVTATVGMNEGITQSFVNYNIKHTLEVLEKQMMRYETSTALGMWDFAVYIVSENHSIANNVAHSYLALTQGEDSYLSNAAINLWRGDLGVESSDAKEIVSYLRNLRHPVFAVNPAVLDGDSSFYVYPPVVTTTTALSGKELAYSLNFPRKSISGLPVFECAEFGRNVVKYGESQDVDQLRLGQIFHMNQVENVEVDISRDSLTSHAFITGSTGSGKSNTIYTLLDRAYESGVKFMVIEPAKGEYKNAFGNEPDVSVYGTNHKNMELLKINPFSFPESIHVLEHMDRLVELFNVCWPMYAAMPAVLKDAVEKSYIDCGWDLIESTNPYGENLFPCFADVARNVRTIIDSSEYDNENKGAYKGSLLTRLQSLTNGLNGLIFTQDEIPSNKLFDDNVIVDLSRVGSSETKSLIMGMLVLKLQEYRMSESTEINSRLKHLTVLEEAHNILKRTSTEQLSESGNLMGKSVEMLSNAIAEMRTYGEGFIIADQAPGLLDMSVIRNTNTKIIMRLPDLSDRELVGRAANLNDNQIAELAKLPCGVGAVYQNEWIHPVLCKIDKVSGAEGQYSYQYTPIPQMKADINKRISIAEMLSKGMKISGESELKEINRTLDSINADSYVRVAIIRLLQNPPQEPRMTKLAPIMGTLFPEVKESVARSFNEAKKASEWTEAAEQALKEAGAENIEDLVRRDIIQCVITYYFLNEIHNATYLREWHEKGGLS